MADAQKNPPDGPDVSVIVASFNVAPLLSQCLASLPRAVGEHTCEVFVVDNQSEDGTPDMVRARFPWVRLLVNDRNVGFSRANNRALREARGRFVLLLNPDTVVPPETLPPLVAYLTANPEVGLAGCRLERPDGGLDDACKRSFPTPTTALARFLHLDRLFPKSRLFGAYRRTYDDPRGTFEVDSIVGAFMLCRREVLEDVGGLDEDFFMYGEDLDWCYRVKRKNWKVMYVGDQRVIHHKGASTRKRPQKMNFHFHRSMVVFHRKHLVDRYPFFVNWLVYCGIGARFALRSVVTFFRSRGGGANPPTPVTATGALVEETAREADQT